MDDGKPVIFYIQDSFLAPLALSYKNASHQFNNLIFEK